MSATQRILLVEDTSELRALYMLVLSMRGFDVVAVEEAETAFCHLKKDGFA